MELLFSQFYVITEEMQHFDHLRRERKRFSLSLTTLSLSNTCDVNLFWKPMLFEWTMTNFQAG